MAMMMLDGNGIAVVIAAAVAGVASLATVGMQVVTFIDTRKLKMLSLARDGQIGQIKALVNGKSEILQAYVAKEAYEKGREHERVAPGTPSPVLAVAPVQTVVTAVSADPDK